MHHISRLKGIWENVGFWWIKDSSLTLFCTDFTTSIVNYTTQYLESINVAFKCCVNIYFAYEMDVHVAVLKSLSCYMHLHELHIELAKPKCKYSLLGQWLTWQGMYPHVENLTRKIIFFQNCQPAMFLAKVHWVPLTTSSVTMRTQL